MLCIQAQRYVTVVLSSKFTSGSINIVMSERTLLAENDTASAACIYLFI